MPMWAAEAEIDEELQEVDLSHAIGNYVQNDLYDDGEPSIERNSECCVNGVSAEAQTRIDDAALAAMQQQMAQQAAFAQIPDVVKRVRSNLSQLDDELTTYFQFIVHFHQAVVSNNLEQITASYESGWNRLTEKYYAKTEWPEAEIIAPLVNDGV